MARVFIINKLPSSRVDELIDGNGCYIFDLRERTPARLSAMSTGFTVDELEAMAGHFVAIKHTNDGRAVPIAEQFEGVMDWHSNGSFNYDALRRNCPRPYSNSMFNVKAICLDCGKAFRVIVPANHDCDDVECEDCGNVLHTTEERTAHRCRACQVRRNERIYSYHGRPHKHDPLFEKIDKRHLDVHLGAEIEVDGCARDYFDNDDSAELSRIVTADPFTPFMEFEHDSSIDGGVECITRPMTFSGFWKMREKLTAFYDKARDLRGTFARANGLHFHIDRAFFGGSEEESGKASVLIELMVYKYYDFFKAISRREDGRFSYACKKDGVNGLYGAFANSGYQDHCHAVNGGGDYTIELRFFGGHISTGDDFLACADIAQAIARWAKGATLTQADRATPCDLIKYLRKPGNVLSFMEGMIDERPRTIQGEAQANEFKRALRERISRNNAPAMTEVE